MRKINYDFRASALASNLFSRWREAVRTKIHLKQLAPEFPSLFNDIDINKLKIDAEAVNILTAACETISIILDAKNKSDKPVYAALGEIHNMPAHMLHHMLVIKGVSDRGASLSIGREYPEAPPRQCFMGKVKQMLGPEYCEETASQYFDHNDLAPQMLPLYSSPDSSYSFIMLNQILLEQRTSNDVTVKLTDAACSADVKYLDDHDEDVQKYADGHTKIESTSVDGMRIRNQTMVKNMPMGDVMIQISGSGLVDDDNPRNHIRLNADTLIAFAKNAGFEPVGRILHRTKSSKMNAELYPDKVFENQEYLSAAAMFSNVMFKYSDAPSLRWLEKDGREISYVNTKMDVLGMGDVCDIDLVEFRQRAIDAFYQHVNAVCDITRAQRAAQVGNNFSL